MPGFAIDFNKILAFAAAGAGLAAATGKSVKDGAIAGAVLAVIGPMAQGIIGGLLPGAAAPAAKAP